MAVLAAAAAPAGAQTWRYQAGISLQETATNNVNLDPSNSRTSDLVTSITPTLSIQENGERTSLVGALSVPVLFYARTGDQNNSVYPSLNLVGDVDLYNKIFHVEGSVSVAQQFFTPFGAQPGDFVNPTDNRYQTATYRISPYLKGVAENGISYELRNNNVWTNLSGAPISTNNSRYTQWIAKAESTENRTFAWRANYDYSDIDFENESTSLRTQLARLVPIYNVEPQLRLEASIGYEDNQGTLTSSKGTIYGVGLTWRPTDRTNVVGLWEHRFFGSSYLFSFDHRMPLSIWSVRASRNITTYPQQLGTLQGGTNVSMFLNDIFASRITDPVARQQAVDNFINERGLPETVAGPVTLYGDQIVLQQQQSATAGLIGVRNTILFSIFNIKSEPIAASGAALPPILAFGNDNTQTGGSLVWTSRFTNAVNLVASASGYRTVTNISPSATTTQADTRVTLFTPVGARMTAFIGARYQTLNSDVASDYNEAAVFVGIGYTLR